MQLHNSQLARIACASASVDLSSCVGERPECEELLVV